MESMDNSTDISQEVLSNEIFLDIRERVLELESLPAPDSALVRLLGLLNQESCTPRAVTKAIEKDPSIASQVLKIANSAFYGLRGKINSIDRAIVFIGMEEVKNICLTTCLSQQFKGMNFAPSFDVPSFWRHCLLTAILSRNMAAKMDWLATEEAYLFGLLHDLGRLVIASVMHDYFERIILQQRNSGLSLFEAELVTGSPHTTIGSWLAVRWGLPDPVREVILYHHNPTKAGKFTREASLVQIASFISKSFESPGTPGAIQVPASEVLTLAGISEEELSQFTDAERGLDKVVADFFAVLFGPNGSGRHGD